MRKYIYTDISNKNSNKVWQIDVIDKVVVTEYARVGYALQRSEKTFSSESSAKHFADSKIREKLDKGYVEIDVIESGTVKKGASLNHIELKRQLSVNPEVDKFIERIIDANIHQITTNTTLTRNTDGLFSTPLGIVTRVSINKARDLLYQASLPNANIGELTNQYLRLIPHNIGMSRASVIDTVEQRQKENDILDALESSWDTAQNIPIEENKDTASEPLFDINFELVNNSNEALRIVDYFEKSKSIHHGERNKTRVINVFELTLNKLPKIDVSNNSVEVFHGTGEGNLLSIMKNGLMTAPPSAASIAGKMFGNGIYGAINSTKSMGYTRQGYGQSGWMFICLFQMGKYYHPSRTISVPPAGYDSVWARTRDCNLLHDELIVYQNNRVQITHLLEFK